MKFSDIALSAIKAPSLSLGLLNKATNRIDLRTIAYRYGLACHYFEEKLLLYKPFQRLHLCPADKIGMRPIWYLTANFLFSICQHARKSMVGVIATVSKQFYNALSYSEPCRILPNLYIFLERAVLWSVYISARGKSSLADVIVIRATKTTL